MPYMEHIMIYQQNRKRQQEMNKIRWLFISSLEILFSLLVDALMLLKQKETPAL